MIGRRSFLGGGVVAPLLPPPAAETAPAPIIGVYSGSEPGYAWARVSGLDPNGRTNRVSLVSVVNGNVDGFVIMPMERDLLVKMFGGTPAAAVALVLKAWSAGHFAERTVNGAFPALEYDANGARLV